jgi:hypothetical protein
MEASGPAVALNCRSCAFFVGNVVAIQVATRPSCFVRQEYRVSEIADRNAGVVLKINKERLQALKSKDAN